MIAEQNTAFCSYDPSADDCKTISQNDILNGPLICGIGVARVRPAEFVIFRSVQHAA